MMTNFGPMVLEFNCRFGDPEAQVILPKLETDLYDIIEACLEEKLDTIQLKVKKGYAVATVAVSKGYPNKYEKGKEILGMIVLNIVFKEIKFYFCFPSKVLIVFLLMD